jgi:hypothetical protein
MPALTKNGQRRQPAIAPFAGVMRLTGMSQRWPLLVVAALAVARPAVAGNEAFDAESMRLMFPIIADQLALHCAHKAPMPAKLAVHLKSDAQSRITVTTKATGPFARCFIRLSNQTHSEGPFDRPPEPFELSLDLTFTSPQRQLQNALDVFIALGCQPRPGYIPTKVAYDVTSNASGLSVQVTTTPDNAEVADCLDDALRERLAEFGPADWDLKAHSESALAAPLTSDWLQHIVRDKAPAVATNCAPSPGGVTHVELRVHAHPDDPELSVDVKADRGGNAYRNCVASMLTPVLHDAVAVLRKLPDGTVERYFRIVSDLDTTVSLDVAGPP